MAHEKLIETVGVKMTDDMAFKVKGIAESVGMTESGWVRSLIEAALAEKEREYLALHSIFGQNLTETKDNGGNRG